MKTELFLNRHIGPRQDEIKRMLNSIGLNSIEELIEETIPKNIRLNKDIHGTFIKNNTYRRPF